MNDNICIEGAISVKAALSYKRREIYKIYIDKKKKDKNTDYIRNLAKKMNVPVEDADSGTIINITDGNSHGGICAVAGKRSYQNSDDILKKGNPFILLLEGIEDPFNFGYCIRSAYAAGATGILTSARNWSNAEPVILKSSAGASEMIDIACSDGFKEILLKAKDIGLTVISADRKDAAPLYETDLKRPVILAIGGQMRGLSKDVKDLTDERIYIPYENGFRNALNASCACAVVCFEAMRQRTDC